MNCVALRASYSVECKCWEAVREYKNEVDMRLGRIQDSPLQRISDEGRAEPCVHPKLSDSKTVLRARVPCSVNLLPTDRHGPNTDASPLHFMHPSVMQLLSFEFRGNRVIVGCFSGGVLKPVRRTPLFLKPQP